MGRVTEAGGPEALGGVGGDLRRLLAVVLPVRDEVLEDDLLDVLVAGERLQRRHPVLLGLADADEDPARERDLQLAGGLDRGQADVRVLGGRALVGDQVRVRRLEHQALARRDGAQAGEIGGVERPEVGVRQDAAFERLLARPHDVGDEVFEAERVQLWLDVRLLAGQHEQFLDPAPRGVVDQALDLLRLVQVGLVRRERAVLAVGAARPRERERDVARKSDPAHPFATIPVCDRRPSSSSALALAGCGGIQSSVVLRRRAPRARRHAERERGGVFLATARGYDEAEGVTLKVARTGDADFRLVATPPRGCVVVMAVVRPDKLVLCVDEVILQDERPEVLAVVRALSARLHAGAAGADEAVSAMDGAGPGSGPRPAVNRARQGRVDLDGGAPYFGQIASGQGRDSTVVPDARKQS